MSIRYLKNIMGLLLFFTLLILIGIISSNSNSTPLYPDTKLVFTKQCSDNSNLSPLKEELPIIYFVTPTYSRREQIAELTRLSQTLLHVKNLVWIVAEDSESCSNLVEGILSRSGIPFVHLVSPMPKIYKKEYYKPRGVSSRNAALEWIEQHANLQVVINSIMIQ